MMARFQSNLLLVLFSVVTCLLPSGCHLVTPDRTPSRQEEDIRTQPLTARMPQIPVTVSPDATRSYIHLYLYRSGTLARLGHNHVIRAPVSGTIKLHPKLEEMYFELLFPVTRLVVDDPDDRTGAGAGFSYAISDEAASKTRENMLGAQILDAEHHPLIRLESLSFSGQLPLIQITANLTIKSVTRKLNTAVKITQSDNHYIATGSFVISQKDFDIEPFSILGGALSVRDLIDGHFYLVIPKDET